jgi:RNA polymerase sigma-70 factor (ECF subfamily)
MFTTWFYRVIMNASHDLMRKTGRTTVSDPGMLEIKAPRCESEQSGYEQRQLLAWQQARLEAGIKALPSSQRDALNLVVYCGLPQAQAAEVMGVSLKALESLLVRAKRSLSKSVAAEQAAAQRNKVTYVK